MLGDVTSGRVGSSIYAIGKVNSSLGIGQVRLSTAREVTEYAIAEQGIEGDWSMNLTTCELIRQLEDPRWNIRYVAGYLRKLADIRGTKDFTIQEMQILIWTLFEPDQMPRSLPV